MTELQKLSRIEKGDLREAWPHEAADFTPWLAEHISELGEALGMELELQSQEARVGTFSLDLLACVSGTDRMVIIENQLEPTNHDHLGKLLTYAGGYDANVIIWVAKDFRDEHRQALDWLNQRTDENTEFFGVVVEVWKIDGSRPAPHFNLVATPNEWQREAAEKVRMSNVSDKSMRYKSFFQKLIDRLRQKQFTTARKAPPKSWCTFSSGYGPRAQYVASFNLGRRVGVEIYMNSDMDSNKILFDQLMERKKAIESKLGESLEWERLDHRKASRIAIRRQGSIDDDQKALKEMEDWTVGKLMDFKRVFSPHLDFALMSSEED